MFPRILISVLFHVGLGHKWHFAWGLEDRLEQVLSCTPEAGAADTLAADLLARLVSVRPQLSPQCLWLLPDLPLQLLKSWPGDGTPASRTAVHSGSFASVKLGPGGCERQPRSGLPSWLQPTVGAPAQPAVPTSCPSPSRLPALLTSSPATAVEVTVLCELFNRRSNSCHQSPVLCQA